MLGKRASWLSATHVIPASRATRYRDARLLRSTLRVRFVMKGDIGRIACSLCLWACVALLQRAKLCVDAARGPLCDNLYDVNIRLGAVTKARIFQRKMAIVVTVQNPANAMRATLTSARADMSVIARLCCSKCIDQMINKIYGPRGRQTAMRGTRLSSSPHVTDRFMRWGDL